jgi:DNA invertase Pin-like site-specific DNA recombinase
LTVRIRACGDCCVSTEDQATTEREIVVYERVSTTAQDIARQAAQRTRAAADSPERTPIVIQDDGVSAFKVSIFDRPGGRRLCELIEAGRVEAIYTDAQDRLSRGDDVEWVTFRALCEAHGVRVVIDGRELRHDLGGRLEGYLKAVIARQESLEKSHRVKTGKAASAAKGRRNGGPRPYGYRQTGGALTIVAHEAEVLHRIRLAVIAGKSLSRIARDLNDDNVPTARGVDADPPIPDAAEPVVRGARQAPRPGVRRPAHCDLRRGDVERVAIAPASAYSGGALRSRQANEGNASLHRPDASVRLLRRVSGSSHDDEQAGQGLRAVPLWRSALGSIARLHSPGWATA